MTTARVSDTKTGASRTSDVKPHRWALAPWARAYRRLARPLTVTRHVRHFCRPLTIDGAEQLERLQNPALIIANHASHFDTAVVLSLLPNHIYSRTAIVAAADRMYRERLKGMWHSLRYNAFPITRGGGSVILIASQLGRVASPGRAAYCASKGALIQLAKVLAADHAEQGIRANTLSPGAVETRRMLRRWKDMDEARRMMGPKHLLGRLGRPEEIARAAIYLASDASSFMTGSDLLVDGGYTAV